MPISRRTLRAFSGILVVITTGSLAAASDGQELATPPSLEPADVAEALALRGEVHTHLGRTFAGAILRADAHSLTIQVEDAGGDAEITFPREDVVTLRLGGSEYLPLALDLADRGELAAALRVLHAILRQRGPLLAYLTDADRLFFVEAAERFRTGGEPLTSVALARQLEPLVKCPEARTILARERMLGYLQLGFLEEAREEALSSVSEQPLFLSSAIGHYVLARIEEASENPSKAIALALRPVVYASDDTPYLAECYDLAIRLAEQLEDTAAANRLRAERDQRATRFLPHPQPLSTAIKSN